MNFSKTLTKLNIVFSAEVTVFTLIVLGILPREYSIVLALCLAIYLAVVSLEDGTILFIRSIPLFIAIPITANYDNFNSWRILSIVLFLKMIFQESIRYYFYGAMGWFKNLNYKNPTVVLGVLLLLAGLSVIPAIDKVSAITRIIYFINLSLIGMVVYDLTRKNPEFTKRVIKNITIPVILVTIVGYIQVTSTYFIDIYQFMRIWGEGIQLNQFGTLWSNIAVRLGNTWFAYYGEQLSLRVFSLFPDSHSFPQFILIGLPAIFAIALQKITDYGLRITDLKIMVKARAKMFVLWIPLIFLMAILSGTRGIWAASIGVLILAGLIIFWMKKTKADVYAKNIFKYISLYMVTFFLLFAVAYPIFVSPQFLLSKGNLNLFRERIKSIIDFGETSNSQRIEIWQASVESIKEKPVLGVGIGNFPVVLDQQIFLARAGSSAHNIYLHIASEMGIPALLAFLWFLWLIFRKTYKNFIAGKDNFIATYFGASLLFIPWVLIYSLTDVAIFDERTMLLLITAFSLILATKNSD